MRPPPQTRTAGAGGQAQPAAVKATSPQYPLLEFLEFDSRVKSAGHAGLGALQSLDIHDPLGRLHRPPQTA